MASNRRRGSAQHGNAGAADNSGEERHHISTAPAPAHSKLLKIEPHSKPSHLVVTIEGRAPIVVNAKKLASEKRFRAVCFFRFKVDMTFDGDWSTNVAQAWRNGGAS